MGNAPQGLILFDGIKYPLSGTFTLSHGITPSAASIYFVHDGAFIPKIGQLTIQYGGQRIVLPDCAADRLEFIASREGFKVFCIHVLDRRWRWKLAGRVSGYYNVRRGTGTVPPGVVDENKRQFGGVQQIVPETEKSPRELARLCFEAMNEKRFDVDKLPDTTRPEIEWDYELPADALARLCDSLGCRVVYRWDNRVSIERLGEGRALPTGDEMEGGVERDVPDKPGKIVVVGARTRFQVDLNLEAVGAEPSGKVVPIDELSYAPGEWTKKGTVPSWINADVPHMQCVTKPYYRQLAQATVFRWYRIQTPIHLPQFKEGKEINVLDRILPIEDRQVEMFFSDGRGEPLPAWIYGEYDAGHESPYPLVRIEGSQEIRYPGVIPNVSDGQLVKFPQGFYRKGFSIDTMRGIVVFADPVTRPSASHDFAKGTGGGRVPALLRLRTTISLRDEKTRGWLRPEWSRKIPGAAADAPVKYILREDIQLNVVMKPGSELTDNREECRAMADFYLDAYARMYEPKEPSGVTYAGLKLIQLDGAIQQVTWSVSEEGFFTTRATRHREDLVQVQSYEERRLVERLHATLAAQPQTSSQAAAKHDKGRA